MGGVQWSKDHGVHDREDGRGGADAEAQRQDDDGRESRISRQHAKRVLKVTLRVIDPTCAATVAIERIHWFDASKSHTVAWLSTGQIR
jgi:hypothetical protein